MDAYYLSSLFATIFGLFLGAFVFVKSKGSSLHKVYSLFLISLCFWIFGDFFHFTPLVNYGSPTLWYKISQFGGSLTSAFYFHFILLFTQFKIKPVYLYLSYGIFCFFAVADIFSDNFIKTVTYDATSKNVILELGWIYNLFLVCVLVAALISVVLVYIRLKRSSGNIREQMRYFLSGTLIIVVAVMFFSASKIIGININLDNILLVTYTSVIAYAFTKKRLLDINIVISRTLAVAISFMIFGGGYLAVASLYNYYISRNIDSMFLIITILFIVTTAVAFEKIKIHIITKSQKLLLKGYYNYKEILLKISTRFQSVTDISEFIELMKDTFEQELELSSITIFLPEEYELRSEVSQIFKKRYETKSEKKYFDLNGSYLIKFINRERNVVFFDSSPKEVSKELEELFSTAALGCFDGEKLICLVLIGKKLSENALNNEDFDLFSTLTTQITNNLKRIQQTRLSAELDVAKNIQQEILPKVPKIEGLELDCFMLSAEEVGGDYYDILNFENDSWIVLGDVVGHGVAAGLTMFMVQSILTTLLATNKINSPAELNFLANRILFNNLERLNEQRPMTIITLTTNNGRNFKVSGSHDNIYIYRANQSKVEVKSVENFPLGIGLTDMLERESFGEDEFELHKDDILFLATDGIVEAPRNGDDAQGQFGEEALIKLIENNARESVSNLKQAIITELDTFTNKTYLDDITFIIAKAS